MTIHGGYDGWGLKVLSLAQGWNKVELDASAFSYLPGQICLVLQDPNAVSLAGEWKVSSFYGVAPNVALNAADKNLAKWDYGQTITVGKATDATYGNVWTVIVGETAEQSIINEAFDLGIYEKVYFYVYNPCDYNVRLTIHGGYDGWGLKVLSLAQGWNKVELDASAFGYLPGQICLVLQDPNAVSLAGEWKVSSFYGVAPNALSNAAEKTLTKWDYGQEITVEKATDAAYGNVWMVTVGETAEQSIMNEAIDTTGYAKVYFYVYNPCDYNVRLTIHGGYEGWNLKQISLAQGWNKVELDASAFNYLPGQICLVLQDPNAVSVAGEWMITSFYGVKA